MNDKPPTLPPELQDWTGTFDDLVSTSAHLLAQTNPSISAPSGSAVRYYQQNGVVGRGTAQGRTRLFSAKELEQVITAKQMAEQNVPLALVRSAIEQKQATPAEQLVAQMLRQSPTSDAPKMTSQLARSAIARRPLSGSVAPATAMFNQSFGAGAPQMLQTAESEKSEYVTLPAGGTVRYALDAGTTVELSTHESTQAQAEALRRLADQLMAGLSSSPHPKES